MRILLYLPFLLMTLAIIVGAWSIVWPIVMFIFVGGVLTLLMFDKESREQ